MTSALVAMVLIVIIGVIVMAVATIAHALNRSYRLRRRWRSRLVPLVAWSYRVRRQIGQTLGPAR